jgi:1,2-diacylglycerol 3-beta-galactosyltransferase
MHLPVIVERNAWTLPQERYNAEFLTEKRLGIVLKNFQEIASGVRQMLTEPAFQEFQSNARNYSNRALFEVPVILNEILEHGIPYSMTAATFSRTNDWAEAHAAWAGV